MRINIEFELEEINYTGKMSGAEIKEELVGYINALLVHDKYPGDDSPVLWAIDKGGYVHTFKIEISDFEK